MRQKYVYYVLCPMSFNLRIMSYVLCLITFAFIMSYVLFVVSYVLCLMSYILCLMSYVLCLMGVNLPFQDTEDTRFMQPCHKMAVSILCQMNKCCHGYDWK